MTDVQETDLYDDVQIETLEDGDDMQSVSFSASIYDAKYIKSLIELLKNTTNTGVFIFSKNDIKYIPGKPDVSSNGENKIKLEDAEPPVFNVLTIWTKNLQSYKIDPPDAVAEVGVNMEDMKLISSIISNKDSLEIYKYANDRKLYFRIKHLEKGQNGIESYISSSDPYVLIYKNEKSDIEIPKFSNSANCNVDPQLFSKMCANMSKIKSVSVVIRGYKSGMVVEATSPAGLAGNRQEFGSVDYENEEPIEVYHINTNTLKKISKLNNISGVVGKTQRPPLKFYLEKNKPIKITGSIGVSLGEIDIYLKNMSDRK